MTDGTDRFGGADRHAGLEDEILRSPGEEGIFDIVATDENDPAMTVDPGGLDQLEPWSGRPPARCQGAKQLEEFENKDDAGE